MDFNLDFVNPEEEEGLDKNEEKGEGVNQPHNGQKSNKCNQCDYACSQAGDLRRLKIHNGEKLNKCNQCYFGSSHAGNLRRHLKMYGPYAGGEKECN